MMSLLEEDDQQQLVSLEQAIQSLIAIVPGIEQMIEEVKQNITQLSVDHLSSNESASIMLYALKWKTSQSSFSFILNETLRSQSLQELRPWLLYLRLFINALSKLPSTSLRTVYHGLRTDVTREYLKGEKFIWRDFVSCTSSIDFATDSLYENEPKVIFIIECYSAKDISKYSFNNNENEFILYPERKFQVISSFNYVNQLKLVQLKEIRQDNSLIPIPQITPNIAHTMSNLEFIIGQCQPKSTVDLIDRQLTDRKMKIVVNHAIINKQCQKLLLSENGITSTGASIIAKALNNNNTLEFLSLSYNPLSDKGVQYLTNALALNNSKLKTLSLHKTGITDKSIQHLCDMLTENTTLTWLHLGRNKISDQGIRLLSDVLTHHNILKAIDLSRNKLITDSSVDYLVEMLEHNKSLETLWISKCNLSPSGKKKLQRIVQSNSQRFFLLFV
jgi:hypothetical protein